MARVAEVLLILGAATLWYVLAWTWFNGPFDTYSEASAVGVLLLGLGLLAKGIAGLVWVARRIRES